MQLTSLIAPGQLAQGGDPDIMAPFSVEGLEINGITADSRKVRPGFLFVAIPGTVADGATFIRQAVEAGAVAVLAGETAAVGETIVPVLRTPSPRHALAILAGRFYDRQPDTIVAVTGTSGKTSVADFTRQIFAALGRKAASLGTMGLVKPDGTIYGSLTTPGPVELARTLAELEEEGVTHLALEASSHGLDQCRLDGVRLIAGAYTNLGRDHLDYHATLDEYFEAKLRLFDTLLDPLHATAVINADGAMADEVIGIVEPCGVKVITVGEKGDTLRLVDLQRDGFAQRMTIAHSDVLHNVRLKLIGDYQASNALVAAGLVIASGEEPGAAISALAALKGVKGRLEIVGQVRGALAVVDYAHKPEALAAMLAALRPFATGRLICVFGCGGNRDKGKRSIMGRIASENADVVIVTDDNPRSEAPAVIRAMIMADARDAMEIGDRAEAINAGVKMLNAGDVLVVAGKGDETGQIIGDKVVPFSDHDVISAALAGEGAQ